MMPAAPYLALSCWIAIAMPISAQELPPLTQPSPPQAGEKVPKAGEGDSPPQAGERVPKAGEGDRLELETTQITGNRELPRVLYIVPWKRSDLGDLVGKPVGSLLDEVLAPVDRDVFKRENRYYRALQPDDADAAGTRPAVEPPAGDES